MRIRALLAGTLILSVWFTGLARATVILSNLPGTPAGPASGTNLGLGIDAVDRTKAVGLTTGALPLTFDSMVALISNPTPASTLSGGIFSNVGGNPGVSLGTFTPVPIPANMPPTQITLNTTLPFVLLPATSYWFVLDGPATTNSLLWETLTPNTAPIAATGIAFLGYRFSSNGGTTWGASTLFNGVTINATVVPEPTSLGMLFAAGVMLWRRRK